MTRSIKSVHRPEPHIFNPDPDLPADHKGRRFCRCACREDDSIHVTSEDLVADLPPTPPEAQEINDRIMGETGA